MVFFRNQQITPEQQIAFTRRFGALEHHVRKEHRLNGYPDILIVSNVLDEHGQAIGVEDAGRFWHSDLSYKREPSLLSALYALEVPVRDGVVKSGKRAVLRDMTIVKSGKRAVCAT